MFTTVARVSPGHVTDVSSGEYEGKAASMAFTVEPFFSYFAFKQVVARVSPGHVTDVSSEEYTEKAAYKAFTV